MSRRRIETIAKRRVLSYWLVAIGLTVGYAMLRGSTWQGSAQLHTFMEGVATLLALMVGVMALVRFYSKKNNTFLFLGVAFLGTGFLDGYHALVTSLFFKVYLPSDLPSLIPWSWVASRMFLALLMYLSYLAWTRENRLGEVGRIDERAVYLFAGALTIASFLFFAFAPLPHAYYPEIWFHRPEEFVPALFFLLALVGYLRKGAWQHDAFEHWLVLSLVVGLVAQAVFMSYSGQLFDFEFDAAHTLKKVSYLCVLTGLLISMYSIFRQAVEGRDSLVQEIEERKRTEDALKDSEERFRAVVNNSPTKVHIKDLEGRYVLVNKESEKLFGMTEEEAKGKTSADIFPDKQAGEYRAHDQAVLDTGQTLEQEEQWELADGVHTYLTVKFPIRDSSGKVTAIGAIGTDITERKRTEKALSDSESNLVKAQQLAKIGNWRWSIERDELSFYSEEYARIHGVAPEKISDIMKHQMERVIHPEDRDRVAEVFRKVDEEGRDYEIEYRIICPNGEERYVIEIGETVFDVTGLPVEHVGTLQDITQRKAAEEAVLLAMQAAEIANRSKSQFLAAMSHELRTPLNAVLGFSEIMKKETLGPIGNTKYREYADDIHESGKHLLGLINDILDLSKIESGSEELHEDKIEVPELIHAALKLVGQRVRQEAIKIQIEIADQLPPLRADERKLKQILVNLLSNAIKFSDSGGEVALWAWCRMDRGHVFQIIDTGIGIAPEDVPKALSKFGQVDGDLNRRHQGTGLGLPLTKALIELHGGTLDLQSHVGVGTIVTVCFPAERIVRSPHDTTSLNAADKKVG